MNDDKDPQVSYPEDTPRVDRGRGVHKSLKPRMDKAISLERDKSLKIFDDKESST